ncbi:type IV pilus twitching motility protein PilT [Caldicoprobacter algeriensis]|uniref:type IV pilus twitching motility protein PilT n=1 Tax=Caldicoprobacter algeriensis TaxID=699281 RepID=UPI002079C6E1|nr:type IV pilus twitching motility protein PilT [Caldicoprobacter algeriensis]MCM8900920.1 type IV pilus twitching motility protein PilT [Caldicoprobacter algeriensis]
MDIYDILRKAVELKCSDVHISVGMPPAVRLNGSLMRISDEPLTSDQTQQFARALLNDEQWKVFQERGEIDFSLSIAGVHRFRVNAYKQRGSCSLAIRLVNSRIPSFEELGLPPVVQEFAYKKSGLVLVTGPTGSGKSTTLAAIVNKINMERAVHIITLEEPIEYLHRHQKSIVNQREVGSDTKSFAAGLRAVLRQDPDVILIGEMRDLETISIALTAAETGHLVLSTLHTIGAAKTIDRIIDVFPPHQQQQVRFQLSTVLEGVISQQLIPQKDGSGRVAAVEVMVVTPAIRNLIREGKTYQITNVIQTGARLGMRTMDQALLELYSKGVISKEDALVYSVDMEHMKALING